MRPQALQKDALPAIVVASLLMGAASCSNSVDPPPMVTGSPYVSPNSYQTGVFDGYTVSDPTRSRSFAIRVRYPVGAPSPLPLVIFSPGGGPNPAGHLTHEEWGTRLASVGYAVIHMAHPLDDPAAHCAPLGIPPAECDSASIASGATLGAIW